MRTYELLFMVGARCIYKATCKAANMYDAKALAKGMPLPTLEVPDKILVKQIKHKGDRK